MSALNSTLWAFVATALVFDFFNGFNDSANSVATIISSRAMAPRRAMLLSALAHLSGPFLFGVAVATTIGHEVLQPGAATVGVAWAALLGAIGWDIFAWFFGIPSSSSHALVGGLLGAGVASHGWEAVRLEGITKVILTLLTSPIIGFIGGYIVIKLIFFLTQWATPGVNNFFKKSQLFTTTALALSHGANDAQKTMGLITMALYASGAIPTFQVPLWVVTACALSIALGTAIGGWRIIRTLGGKFYKIRPVHAFTSQLASASIILGAALFGGPVSTSHIVSSTILGAGAGERMNQVRWGVMKHIIIAWVLTIPASGVVAGLLYLLIQGRIP